MAHTFVHMHVTRSHPFPAEMIGNIQIIHEHGVSKPEGGKRPRGQKFAFVTESDEVVTPEFTVVQHDDTDEARAFVRSFCERMGCHWS